MDFHRFGLHFVDLLLSNEPEISLRDAQGGVGHGDDIAVAGHGNQVLPIRTEGAHILHRVAMAEFGLDGDEKIGSRFNRCKEDGCRLNPKSALNGKAGAAWHGGHWLGDGAAQLKPRAAAERRAAVGNDAAGDGEPRAALGEDRAGCEQE